jgi:hypothetical protein
MPNAFTGGETVPGSSFGPERYTTVGFLKVSRSSMGVCRSRALSISFREYVDYV